MTAQEQPQEPLAAQTNPSSAGEQAKEGSDRWFAELEARSWEMELLLSGFVLLSLFQLRSYLAIRLNLWAYLKDLSDASTWAAITMSVVPAVLGILSCLQLYFVVHLILRGLWIGVIGLRAIYPRTASFERLGYNKSFLAWNPAKAVDLVTLCVRLNRASNFVFGMACLTILLMTSAALYFLILLLGAFFLESMSSRIHSDAPTVLWTIGGFLFALLLIVDCFSGGWLRKRKATWFRVPYFWLYRAVRLVTLSFLSDPLYYTVISYRRGPLKLLLTFFLTLASTILAEQFFSTSDLGVSRFEVEESPELMVDFRHYENLRPEQKSANNVGFFPTIQQDIFDEQSPFVRLFIPYVPMHDKALVKACPDVSKVFHRESPRGSFSLQANIGGEEDAASVITLPSNQLLKQPRENVVLKCMSDFYGVYINGRLQKDLRFRFFQHPRFHEEAGISAYIPTREFAQGENILTITKGPYDPEDDSAQGELYAIPLWVDRREHRP